MKMFDMRKAVMESVVPLNLIPYFSSVSLLVKTPLAQKKIGVINRVLEAWYAGAFSQVAGLVSNHTS